MATILKDLMTTEFGRLRLDMTMAETCTALASEPRLLGAVFDDLDRPVTLLSEADLEAFAGTPDKTLAEAVAELPPGILAPSSMRMETFLDGTFVALRLGARGVLVMEDNQMVGALTGAAINDFLPLGKLTRTRGDFVLDGSIITGKLVLYCDEFHHRNELLYFNRRKPPTCQVTTPRVHPIRRK